MQNHRKTSAKILCSSEAIKVDPLNAICYFQDQSMKYVKVGYNTCIELVELSWLKIAKTNKN